jgi:hypothetical protein
MKPARLLPLIVFLFAGMIACNKTPPPAEVASGDPAGGNLAPADPPAPTDTSQPAAAPDEEQVAASEAPPPLPQYDQPPAPADNDLWTPGYWGYANAGYYWVPGAWVMAPWLGALWTPPWWGYRNGAYILHAGYWGAHIGFYGGIDYGFGYPGRGYYGAYWNHGQIFYNRTVTNVDPNIVRNYYAYTAPHGPGNRLSYNGGSGGLDARPTAQEAAALREPRIPPMAVQQQHAREAATDRNQFAAPGRSQPAALAAGRPLETEYRSPASLPPVAAPARPERELLPQPNERPAMQPARPQVPESRPMPEARAPMPEFRPAAPEARQIQTHPAPESRPSMPMPMPAPRPAPIPQEKHK